MKKLIASIILAGSLALTGCGSSNDDIFNQIGNINQNPPVVQGYFVNSATGNDTTGNFATGSPYATIQQAVADAPAGSDIIVAPGNYAGTVNLDNGDRLLGSESTLLMGTATTRPILTGNIDMADGNTIDFMAVTGANTIDAVNGTGQNTGTVTNCQFSNLTGLGASGVEINNVSGRWVISNNTLTNIGDFGLLIQQVQATQPVIIVENNTFNTTRGGIGATTGATAQVRAAIRGNVFTNSAGVGAAMELNCGGTTANFCLDLQLNVDNGPTNNGDSYRIANLNNGSIFRIEQLNSLNAPRPGGAANVGNVAISNTASFAPPVSEDDGNCGPF